MEIFKQLKNFGYKHYVELTIEELDKLPIDNIERRIECSLVIDWFREKHGMIILPFMFDEFREDYFSYRIIRRQGNINVHYPYKSYYEAREAAILKAIELCKK